MYVYVGGTFQKCKYESTLFLDYHRPWNLVYWILKTEQCLEELDILDWPWILHQGIKEMNDLSLTNFVIWEGNHLALCFIVPLNERNDDVNSSKDRAHHFPFIRLFLAHFSGSFYGVYKHPCAQQMLRSFGLTVWETRKINEPSSEGTMEIFNFTESSRGLLPCDTVHGSSNLSQETQCHQTKTLRPCWSISDNCRKFFFSLQFSN